MSLAFGDGAGGFAKVVKVNAREMYEGSSTLVTPGVMQLHRASHTARLIGAQEKAHAL
ncbi:hypothetical protein [Arthrobacter cryoconiti]|uniref:Uncharacterized protein n=1 Tax=Arthrobacter cryoconiti TaxID=748907 RepID=A0ABV8R1P7_9MICC|nr:hypothetical protein [Arthrobacter cryoconiti]MCC9068167.1 hypothetical protein [Arthrobacter cryoconiti]